MGAACGCPKPMAIASSLIFRRVLSRSGRSSLPSRTASAARSHRPYRMAEVATLAAQAEGITPNVPEMIAAGLMPEWFDQRADGSRTLRADGQVDRFAARSTR